MTILARMRGLMQPLRARKAPYHLVICGGGASAVLLCHALARGDRAPVRITIIEQRETAGPGLAYGTTCPAHLLNVQARRMSVTTDDSDHFVAWLNACRPKPEGVWVLDDFAPRADFGAYLVDTLRGLAADKAGSAVIDIVCGTAVDLERRDRGWTVRLESGRRVDADAVCLATGNESPYPLGVGSAGAIVLQDPWNAVDKAAIPKNGVVLIIGAALTAVDIALEIIDSGHRGQIFMTSRRGFFPQTHATPPHWLPPWLDSPYPKTIRALFEAVRARVRADTSDGLWQADIDALRPVLPELWSSLDVTERKRYLRHVRSVWEAHRHRVAPAAFDRFADALKSPQIILLRGRLTTLEADPGRGAARAEISCGLRARSLLVDRVINCTGPRTDPARSANPLLQGLIASGLARPDPLRLSLDVDDEDRVLDRSGRAQETLFAMGSLTRGRRWEITAVPEIRTQAVQLSERLRCLMSRA